MIREEKIKAAFAAVQEIFILARWRIGNKENLDELYDLLDGAEYLAGLAVRDEDMTTTFESYLAMICEKHACSQALDVFRKI